MSLLHIQWTWTQYNCRSSHCNLLSASFFWDFSRKSGKGFKLKPPTGDVGGDWAVGRGHWQVFVCTFYTGKFFWTFYSLKFFAPFILESFLYNFKELYLSYSARCGMSKQEEAIGKFFFAPLFWKVFCSFFLESFFAPFLWKVFILADVGGDRGLSK